MRALRVRRAQETNKTKAMGTPQAVSETINTPLRRCRKCDAQKPQTEEFFARHNMAPAGLMTVCRSCRYPVPTDLANAEKARAYRRSHRKQCKAIERRAYMRSKYGISEEEYDALFQEQGGVCAICERPELVSTIRSEGPRRLAIDHDHKTGKVRGLLCFRCNTMLGRLLDNVCVLNRAIEYLQRAEAICYGSD